MITTMRSNDSFMGFIYDTFCFTMMQEMLWWELIQHQSFKDLKLGYYVHNAHSFHLYENYYEKALIVIQETDIAETMAPIKSNQMPALQRAERIYRSLSDNNILELDNTQVLLEPWEQMKQLLLQKRNKMIRKCDNGKVRSIQR